MVSIASGTYASPFGSLERPNLAAWTPTGLFARILYGVALTETHMRKILMLAAGLALIGTSAWSQSSSRDDGGHGRWQESRDRWDRDRDRDDDRRERRGRAMRDDDGDRSGRGARFFLRSGDTQLRVACGDEEIHASLRRYGPTNVRPGSGAAPRDNKFAYTYANIPCASHAFNTAIAGGEWWWAAAHHRSAPALILANAISPHDRFAETVPEPASLIIAIAFLVAPTPAALPVLISPASTAV